jgi:hypothetical protein
VHVCVLWSKQTDPHNDIPLQATQYPHLNNISTAADIVGSVLLMVMKTDTSSHGILWSHIKMGTLEMKAACFFKT